MSLSEQLSCLESHQTDLTFIKKVHYKNVCFRIIFQCFSLPDFHSLLSDIRCRTGYFETGLLRAGLLPGVAVLAAGIFEMTTNLFFSTPPPELLPEEAYTDGIPWRSLPCRSKYSGVVWRSQTFPSAEPIR